jgi:hypothetical protein
MGNLCYLPVLSGPYGSEFHPESPHMTEARYAGWLNEANMKRASFEITFAG